MTIDQIIQSLREAYAKATPGPAAVVKGEDVWMVMPDGRRYAFGDAIYHPENVATARFHALSHNHLPALLDEIERLRAIEKRLPKTADGVLVLPGDIVYPASGTHEARLYQRGVKVAMRGGYEGDVDPSECYFTSEAAEAASKEKP